MFQKLEHKDRVRGLELEYAPQVPTIPHYWIFYFTKKAIRYIRFLLYASMYFPLWHIFNHWKPKHCVNWCLHQYVPPWHVDVTSLLHGFRTFCLPYSQWIFDFIPREIHCFLLQISIFFVLRKILIFIPIWFTGRQQRQAAKTWHTNDSNSVFEKMYEDTARDFKNKISNKLFSIQFRNIA